ncbi:MAG: hypothetical protein Q9222_002181 [Ikaeria aurantiellina]
MIVIREEEALSSMPSKIHPDDWPIHHLKKVNVISNQTQRCVSLLESHKDHAVQVTGLLEATDVTMKQLTDGRKSLSKRVEISNVSFWAFSEESDRSVSLWAAGKAGWFELHDPVPQYRTIFERMNEAVSMLYHLADKLKRSRKSYLGMNAKELDRHVKSAFGDVNSHYCCSYSPTDANWERQYNVPRQRLHIQDNGEANTDRFHSHARFLITSMLEGQDNQDWHKSPFLQYYKHHFPVSFQSTWQLSHAHSRGQDIYEEAGTRLQPKVEFTRAKGKGRVTRAVGKPKQTTTTRAQEQRSLPTRADRRRRYNEPEDPETPKRPSKSAGDIDTSGDEEYDSDGKVIQSGTKRRCKSILQPKGSKYSKKTAGRRQSLPSIRGEAEVAALDSDAEVSVPEASPLAAVSQQEALYPHYLPEKVEEVKMVAFDVPSDQPQGPGDLWTCAFENCSHRVHEASSSKGKAQINDHFQQHARLAQEKIDLAVSESRPYLPIK